jgi:glycosyltransferase involved in cell wall biosynthesis
MKKKIAILGSRGIPNAYGGFEQFAEYLSVPLAAQGMEVYVYCSDKHSYREALYRGVHLIHCKDPEDRLGSAGQFLYDLNCILDSRKRGFDVILQLGYTSSSIWHRLVPRGVRLITNMDGLEWKRSKYSAAVRMFLKRAEKLAVKSSDALVADSTAIQEYLQEKYKVPSTYIPYGAEVPEQVDAGLLAGLSLEPGGYYLLIARMQPDNHVEEAIKGVLQSDTHLPLVVVGNTNNRHGRYLKATYQDPKIRFTGGIFNMPLLNALRYHCKLYFHGHSAGGTNPSLLEAMAASAPICAHNNPFNRAVLGDDAFYFTDASNVKSIVMLERDEDWVQSALQRNLQKIKTDYSWDRIVREYFVLLDSKVENKLRIS